MFPALLEAKSDAAECEGEVQTKFKDLLRWIQDTPSKWNTKGVREFFGKAEEDAEVSLTEDEVGKADTKYHDQAYRAFTALRIGFPADRRVWSFTSDTPLGVIKGALWSTSFLLSRSTKKGAGKDGFLTQVATPFERLMYFMCAVHIASKSDGNSGRSKPPARKRMRKEFVDAQTMPALSDRKVAQRLGYAVQVVIRSWDLLAIRLHFKDVDDMIAPYIVYDSTERAFQVLQERSDGYADKQQSADLGGQVQKGTDTGNACQIALQRSDAVDMELRQFAGMFLEDIRNVTSRPAVYNETPTGETMHLRTLADFHASGDGLPPRFGTVNTTAMDLIAEANKPSTASVTEIGRPSNVSFPYTAVPRRGKQKGTLTQTVLKMPSRVEEAGPSTRSGGGNSGRKVASVVRNEPVLQEGVCKGGNTCECVAARERLFQAMSPYVRMYNCSFTELVQEDNMASDVPSVEGQVQLVLTDPPYNHRRENGQSNSSHDVLTEDDMKETVDTVLEMNRDGGHVVIFTSPRQFRDWAVLFSELKSDEGEVEYKVDPHPLVLINSPGHYFGNVRKKTTALFPVTQWSMHCTKTGLPSQEAFDLVAYSNHGHTGSRYPGWTNVIDNVDRLQPGEALRAKALGSSTATMVRPEQKSRKLLKELISRFTKPGDIVADLFAGTFSTAAACMTLPKHRVFIGCELKEDAYNLSRNKMIELFASVLQDPFSDIKTDSAAILEDAKLVCSHQRFTEPYDPNWNAPKGFPAFQNVPSYIVNYIANAWRVPDFIREYTDVAVSKWPISMKGALQTIPKDQLEALEAAQRGVCIGESTIKHEEAGLGLFTARPFVKDETIGYYYGALVYGHIGERAAKTKTYGEAGELGVTPPEFSKYQMRMKVQSAGIKSGGSATPQKEVYIVPRFCVFRMINDPRYLEDDEERLAVSTGEIHGRQANAVFETSRVRSIEQLSSHQSIEVVALRDIEAGEELFASYGDDYFA